MPTVPAPWGGIISGMITIAILGLLAASIVAGLIDAARRQRDLEQGQRDYPCSHGAVGRQRWPEQPRPRRRRH